MSKSRLCFVTIVLVSMALSLWAAPLVIAQTNLVTNGDFEGGFAWVANPDPWDGITPDQIPNGWTRFETFNGGVVENSALLQMPDNGPSLPGSSTLSCGRVNGGFSGDWSVVYQDLNIDASKCSGLTLTMDVKVISHNLLAGGWSTPAFEWPVLVEIDYNTTGGGNQIWRYGWYINPPGDDGGPSPIDDPGTGLIPIFNDKQVTQGVWDSNSFDLLVELPQLGTITRIYVGGSGWDFEGQVDNVVILCEPVAVGGEAFPIDKTELVLPWIALALAIAAGGIYLIRRRVHSYK
jgi:hypothetical protein